ncbi:MAG TPA: ribose 5-phosphate isomerase B [Thermoflexales bacterium]|mgnify:CR=1 FL=1|nr:ribose 5-phosphate isomerase B [Thermoflexales bacterium]HQW33859.1 ribose 5-phosphate isomerase B [Thermoflexales bacterium]HQZ21002.1 ribose 5-phosphate isomerase B [Thermoflexales bacterium]HQZ99496.1 ribose 5-phosphate isomerase B [Thermoflexales bacterium]
MKVAIAADHGGFDLKTQLVARLKTDGFDVADLGTYDTTRVDYPDYAKKLGEYILAGNARRGILLCGSGVGASVAANKIKGIRASVCHDTYSAHQGVQHDDMNVLVMGGRVIAIELAHEISRAYLAAELLQQEPYLGRLKKVLAMEEAMCQ